MPLPMKNQPQINPPILHQEKTSELDQEKKEIEFPFGEPQKVLNPFEN